MPLVTSAGDAALRSRQVLVNGRDYTICEYVGAAPRKGRYEAGSEINDNGLPQGFLVSQPPGSVTPPHFHEPNQFQVFVEGVGRLGAHDALPITIQYANGHTPYGPIVAGPSGVRYFTLRQGWDPGAKYLPASRSLLRKGNQRTRVRSGIGTASEAERRWRSGSETVTLIAPEEDGLASWMFRLGPAQAVTLPDPDRGGGQYLVVTAGGIASTGEVAQALGRLSALYVAPEEPALNVAAGSDGLDLLVLQFPRLGATLSGGASLV